MRVARPPRRDRDPANQPHRIRHATEFQPCRKIVGLVTFSSGTLRQLYCTNGVITCLRTKSMKEGEGRWYVMFKLFKLSFLDASRVLFNSLVPFFLDLVCTLRAQFCFAATLSLQSIQSQPMSSLWRHLSRPLEVVVVQAHVHTF
jgi:hypothetical protein